MYRPSLITLFIAFLGLQYVYAQETCNAQANFDGCLVIEKTKYSTCNTIDYNCQCFNSKLILQCFNLCPQYTNQRSMEEAKMQAVCAVPITTSTSALLTSSSAAVAQATTSNASTKPTASSGTPSATGTTSSASHFYPTIALFVACVFACLFQW